MPRMFSDIKHLVSRTFIVVFLVVILRKAMCTLIAVMSALSWQYH